MHTSPRANQHCTSTAAATLVIIRTSSPQLLPCTQALTSLIVSGIPTHTYIHTGLQSQAWRAPPMVRGGLLLRVPFS